MDRTQERPEPDLFDPQEADARREAYNRVKAIVIPNMFYRTDIGERWARDGDLLQSWGLL